MLHKLYYLLIYRIDGEDGWRVLWFNCPSQQEECYYDLKSQSHVAEIICLSVKGVRLDYIRSVT